MSLRDTTISWMLVVLLSACASDADSDALGQGGDEADAFVDDGGSEGFDTSGSSDTEGRPDTRAEEDATIVEDSSVAADAPQDAGGTTGTVTYHGQMRAIIESSCLSCHATGGIAPLNMEYRAEEWAGEAPFWVYAAADAVAGGRMPPWQTEDDCRSIEGDFSLSDEEIALFATWAAEGYPVGDEADYVPPAAPPVRELGEPDVVASAVEAYQPGFDRPDDYRCFELDFDIDEPFYINAVSVFPDFAPIVHHVLLYQVYEEDLGIIRDLEAQDPTPGYTCYGGTGASRGGPVGAWVPGMQELAFPEDSAIVIPANARIVMQIHYNVAAVTPETMRPDQTEVAFWTLPADQPPANEVHIVGFPAADLFIPQDDPNVVHERVFNMPADATIIGVAPHMHALGTEIYGEVRHADGETSCAVDVPEWDFDWQGFYVFEEDAFFDVQRGDDVYLRCGYDNSLSNQPIINGERQEPRDVTWGEGTLDEMCLLYLIAETPYLSGGDGEICPSATDCITECSSDVGECVLNCLVSGTPQCGGCNVEAIASCGATQCGATLAPLGSCLDGCDGSLPVCARTECGAEMDAFAGCIQPAVADGSCDAAFSACE